MTPLDYIFKQFNLLSDADFKSWFINEYDNLKDLETQQMVDTSDVTRFEVIDHSESMKGRFVVEYNITVDLQLQDDNRTLKVFLK